ncbi:MAG: hypothetical protein ACHQYQ_11495, partial [Bacteriovoracales bacterium]
VAIKGEENSLEDLKKKADLDMVSSTKYCRGTYIISPNTKWNCSGTECSRTYECKLINKKHSRGTEIPKLKAQIKKKTHVPGTIEMPKVETLTLDKPKPIVKKVDLKIKKEVASVATPTKTDKFEEEALALLNEEDFAGAQPPVPEKISKMDRDITYEELVEPPTKPSPFEKKEADWKLVKTTSREGGMKKYELEKNLDKEERFKKKLKGFGFALGMLNISGTDTNVSSFYFGWVPRWEVAPNWAIRGEIGIQYFAQQFYTEANELIYENNFMVSPYALYLNYYGDFFFVEAGGGFQWWYDQVSDFNPMLAAGVGYRLPDTYFSLDRISLDYDYVMTDTIDLSEIKLSFTFIF